ncbi:MAG TPA: hypothetical protein EYG94_04950, partial [Campylobacterales bacterium]|nr:hypothetical protein [Campylobacterales bacterium]
MKKTIKYFIVSTLLLFSSVLCAVEAGDTISNTASISYSVYGVSKDVKSNTLTHTVEASDAEIIFMSSSLVGTQTAVLGSSAYQDEYGVWHESETSTLSNGIVLGNGSLVNLEDTEFYELNDTAIIKVIDLDKNIDRNVKDVIEVEITADNGDTEILRLEETTVNSGIFIAYIVLSDTKGSSYDNSLYVRNGETIVSNYDNTNTIVQSASAIVIPKNDLNIWLEKQVNKTETAIGELLEYTLIIHNDEAFKINNLLIHDALPLGLKYEEGTA